MYLWSIIENVFRFLINYIGLTLSAEFFLLCSTPLHCSIFCKNKAVFKVLLQHGKPDLELKNADGYTVLWLALQEVITYSQSSR